MVYLLYFVKISSARRSPDPRLDFLQFGEASSGLDRSGVDAV
ncbi:MAG: hypothetical protein P4K98_09855 [Bryobacteraceae bacterium]|nr:hypothetical protein [Bryobacteraceae bacterium]